MAQKLNTIENIKVPFATEGVVRTAQFDDTVAPPNSVQLAVNMNFDRIGAIQTRDGVTEYADDIEGPVRSFGTLSNNLIQEGYTTIFQAPTTNDFPQDSRDISTSKIDDTHFIAFWCGTDTDGFVQVGEIDTGTGAITWKGTALEFDTTQARYNACHKIDDTHYINFWQGSSDLGYVQAFLVNLGTWAVTAIGTKLNFAPEIYGNKVCQIDANHFSNFYTNPTFNNVVSNFEVNLSTFAVTEVGSPYTFPASGNGYTSITSLGDGERVVAFWDETSTVGKAQTFLINTSTWNTTAIGSPLTFDATNVIYNSCISLGDNEHFVNAWRKGDNNGSVQVFNVDPSTYAVTAVGAAYPFNINTSFISNVSMEDGQHFTLFYNGSSPSDGYAQAFEVDLTNYSISATSNLLYFANTALYNTTVLMNGFGIINFWHTTGVSPGPVDGAYFELYGERLRQRFLYAQDGNNDVYNWDGTSWTLRRTGLGTANKARFSQYLGYTWMVNGDEDAGGSPVMVSDGGNFVQGIVPDEFPPGTFIQTGFEGRVWVVESSSGVIYYTDIVQFTPPDTYTLTFDINTNFITSISPQTGQTMTALKEVPRALLVFTEDTITRIYGATSIDSYPAYNVGTYSQESIVTTKAGIFFHHSSGFYQFDYGSQPEEISRPVIDFIKAIPRANYDDIVGVYDGFDNIEWGVGEVTTEGITFNSCMMRYTISTKVWTIYDYDQNEITALIYYDDGTDINHLMGTNAGKVGSIDTGTTDFGSPFYWEYIDRWRPITDMYYQSKNIGSINFYSENAAGANIMYQKQKDGANVWHPIATVTEENNSLIPTTDVGDFDVLRFRVAGTTSGTPVVIHGMEIPELTIKGVDQN